LKELYEETGYGTGKAGGNASVEDVSSVMVKDPGYVKDRARLDLTGSMTGANFNLVTVKVKLGENDPDPEQHLEEVSARIYTGLLSGRASI
jgi:ADP-ribose pyrophosphatase